MHRQVSQLCEGLGAMSSHAFFSWPVHTEPLHITSHTDLRIDQRIEQRDPSTIHMNLYLTLATCYQLMQSEIGFTLPKSIMKLLVA